MRLADSLKKTRPIKTPDTLLRPSLVAQAPKSRSIEDIKQVYPTCPVFCSIGSNGDLLRNRRIELVTALSLPAPETRSGFPPQLDVRLATLRATAPFLCCLALDDLLNN
jgi:hypothetical protein